MSADELDVPADTAEANHDSEQQATGLHHDSISPLMASDVTAFNVCTNPQESELQDPAFNVNTTPQHNEIRLPVTGGAIDPPTTKRTTNDDLDPPGPPSCITFVGSVANLCSATLGAGVLSLPFALYQSGLVGGFLLLFFAAWTSIVSIRFLVLASDEYGIYTYEGLVKHVLGNKAKRFVEVAMIVFCGGCAVAYVMAVGDILQQIVPQSPTPVSICLVWGIAMLPLSLLRRMESLQWASGIGVASIMTLVVAVLVHFEEDATGEHREHGASTIKDLLWPSGGFLSLVRACPMVIFAFSCQVNVCAIYHELPSPQEQLSEQETSSDDDNNEKKPKLMQKVTLTSVLGCATLYALISTFALSDFGTTVQPNILINYCPRGIMHVAFGCMALAVVMAFPLNVFPARVAIESMMNKASVQDDEQHLRLLEEPLLPEVEEDGEGKGEMGDQEKGPEIRNHGEGAVVDNVNIDKNFNLCQHVTLTLGIAGSALALALVVPNISVVFGLLGGTTSSALGFVIPGLLGRSLRRHQSRQSSIQAWILVVGGTLVGILSTGVTVWSSLIQPQTSTQPLPDACDDGGEPTASPIAIATVYSFDSNL